LYVRHMSNRAQQGAITSISLCMQFTAAYMLGSQVLTIYREAFVDRCGECKGAGRVICKHCGGTKTGRRRPAEFHYVEQTLVDRSPLDL
jgi:hypothetical protein